MAKFLIYLFESGLCLSLFYLGYIFFFRKETYFTFNRFYLIGSMILALSVPLLSIPVDWGDTGYIHETANGVNKVKDYYEHLILLTDPSMAYNNNTFDINQMPEVSSVINNSKQITISSILIIIYSIGVLFFAIRFIYLLWGLRQMAAKATIEKRNGLNLVLINDEVPSFSFLRWVFVNPNLLKPDDFEQVLTHEKVHVQHKHSVDLLIANILTIFQWFNPLTWRIQKSLKTCHEYIADRQVVNEGHALFDYQSLLLSQLISIRSVELVNNFNLLSIKKRIAMMNKHKSGTWAYIKAIAIVPILLVAFFLFADMTSRSEKLNFEVNTQSESEAVLGQWMAKEHIKGNVQFLDIKPDKVLAIIPIENNAMSLHQYLLETDEKKLIPTDGDSQETVKYKLVNDNLFVNWNKKDKIEYIRIKENSYTLFDNQFEKLNLPYATQLAPYKKEMVLCTIFLSDNHVTIDGKSCSFNELENKLAKLKSTADNSKTCQMPVLMNIDKDAKMQDVDKIKTALRNTDNLKLGYLARLAGNSGTDYMALFNLLPPKDAKWIEEKDLGKEGIALFKIGKKYSAFSKSLEKHIKNNPKYVMRYEYDNKTSYNDYIQTLDLVYKTINIMREKEAASDNVNYKDLSYDDQATYRKKYPITLTMINTDQK